MEFATEHFGDVVRLAPRGRIDSATANELAARVSALVTTGCKRLVIDFRDVPYITSAGFRCLLVAEAGIQQSSGGLVLCGLAKELQRLFQIAAFDEHFTIVPSVEEGVARLRA